MPPIEPLGVSGAEPLHRLFQIGLPGSYQKVVMVIHQHVGENVNIEPLRHLPDSFQETVTILVAYKYIAAFIAAR